MIGKSYLNKVAREGGPYAIYLLSVLAGAAISEVGAWTTILMLNAVLTITVSYDFGRNQMIIAGVSKQTFSIGVYALTAVILVLLAFRISKQAPIGLLLVAVGSGLLTVYLQHAASLKSASGEDGNLQMLNIVLAVTRGLGITLAALLDNPSALFCIYGIGLLLCLRQSRIQFDSRVNGIIKNKNELAIAVVSVIGLISLSLDKVIYYPLLEPSLVKPYSIISMLFMGAMFLSALWFRMQDSAELNARVLYRLIIIAYGAFSASVLIGSYFYQESGSVNGILFYAFVMATWGWVNIASQTSYKQDYKRGIFMPRLISVALIPLVIFLIHFLDLKNAVLVYWIGMVASQCAYLLGKQVYAASKRVRL